MEEKKWKNRLGNNKKKQKITRNTETRRDKISTRFREMLKTKTRMKTRFSRMSQNDYSRAKTRSRPTPSP